MTSEAEKPLRIFCSYSHRDEQYLNDLHDWLRGLERQGLIEWWHDREIAPGWEWEEAIDKNLRTADIILLLVTHAFMASDYVYEQEISKAVERHDRGEARVIPIIVRPSYWEWASFGKLQALPKDAKPITSWLNRDEAWLDVLKGIEKAVREVRGKSAEGTCEKEHRPDTQPESGNQLREASPSRTGPRPADRSQQTSVRLSVTASTADRVQLLRTIRGGGSGSFDVAVAFSPDGELLAVGSSNAVRLWRVEDGAPLRTLEGAGHLGTFSPDGRLLASSHDETVQLWRVEDGVHLRTLTGHAGGVNSVAFSPDGQLLAAATENLDEQVRLWDVERGAVKITLKTPRGRVATRLLERLGSFGVEKVAFSPDGQLLAACSDRVRLWRVETRKMVRELKPGWLSDRIFSVAFSPDGRLLAATHWGEEKIMLWHALDGVLLRTLEGHTKDVQSVAFSPDGQLLASGSEDKTVGLWRVEDGALLRTLTGQTRGVNSVAFSPDGQLLASGSFDESVRMWGIA